jgi:hypothetical protein
LLLRPTDLSHLKHLQTEYQKSARGVEAIIGWSQLTAAQREQLWQQSEVASRSAIELQEAVFWMDNTHGLTQYKFTRSKWVDVDMRHLPTELHEVYSHALKAMNDMIFIDFHTHTFDSRAHHSQVAELIMIRHLPSSVTSIHVPNSQDLPAIQ